MRTNIPKKKKKRNEKKNKRNKYYFFRNLFLQKFLERGAQKINISITQYMKSFLHFYKIDIAQTILFDSYILT